MSISMTKMVTRLGEANFDLSVLIRRQPAEVFAFLADVQEAEPIPRRAGVRMEKHPPGVTAVGTRWDEWVHVAPGCWLHIVSRVTEVEAPGLLGMEFASRWFTGHLTYTLAAADDGCVLRQREVLRPRRYLRPWTRLIAARLGPRLVQRLADIRFVLQADGGEPSPGRGPVSGRRRRPASDRGR